MGQKVSPISLRVSINKTPDSRWIAGKKEYATKLAEDLTIRRFIERKLKKAGLAKVVIERFATRNFFDVQAFDRQLLVMFSVRHRGQQCF